MYLHWDDDDMKVLARSTDPVVSPTMHYGATYLNDTYAGQLLALVCSGPLFFPFGFKCL